MSWEWDSVGRGGNIYYHVLADANAEGLASLSDDCFEIGLKNSALPSFATRKRVVTAKGTLHPSVHRVVTEKFEFILRPGESADGIVESLMTARTPLQAVEKAIAIHDMREL